MTGKMALLLGLAVLLTSTAPTSAIVPGDTDGDMIVSDDEVRLAEQDYNDDKISADDLDEIRHIHDNYPRTIEDSSGRSVTIYKPIERIAVLDTDNYEVLRVLNVQDHLVGAGKNIIETVDLYPETSELINVGTAFSVDYEALLRSNPDLVISYTNYPEPGVLEKNLESTGINVVRFDINNINEYLDDVAKAGYLLEREAEAGEYADFYEEKLGTYLDSVSRLSDDEKPKVYLEADFGGKPTYWTVGETHPHHDLLLAAGGDNMYSNVIYYKEVSPESVAMENPDVILRYFNTQKDQGLTKEIDDTASLEEQRDNVLDRAELKNVPAVKNKRVYIYTWDCTRGAARYFLGIGYIGKWLQPQIFEDYSPRDVYQEYLNRFQGVDIDVVNKGVFVYPEP